MLIFRVIYCGFCFNKVRLLHFMRVAKLLKIDHHIKRSDANANGCQYTDTAQVFTLNSTVLLFSRGFKLFSGSYY